MILAKGSRCFTFKKIPSGSCHTEMENGTFRQMVSLVSLRVYPSSPLVDQAKLKLRLKRRERVMLSDGSLWKLGGRWWQVSMSRHRSGAARSLQVLAKDPLQEGVRVNAILFCVGGACQHFYYFFPAFLKDQQKTNWSFCGLAKFLRISEKALNTIRFFFGEIFRRCQSRSYWPRWHGSGGLNAWGSWWASMVISWPTCLRFNDYKLWRNDDQWFCAVRNMKDDERCCLFFVVTSCKMWGVMMVEMPKCTWFLFFLLSFFFSVVSRCSEIFHVHHGFHMIMSYWESKKQTVSGCFFLGLKPPTRDDHCT